MAEIINNTASASYNSTGSSDSVVNSNNVSVSLERNLGLTVTKTNNPSTFLPGDIISYSVTITNTSSSYLTGVRIVDDLGGMNLAYVVGSAKLSTSTQTYSVSPVVTSPLTFTLQQLSVGGSMTLTYNAQVIFNLPSSVGSITNNVRAIGYTSSGTVNGVANSTILKKNELGVSLKKSVSKTELVLSESFDYILTLSNNSGIEINGVVLTDNLPSNFVLTGVQFLNAFGQRENLSSSDYSLLGNTLTVSMINGVEITLVSGSNLTIYIVGYFN
ncbi:MAG: DUF11 domain-containing protein [Clostridia bacterium]|nr:DUF11 domain-containing protein [Clostridia bacterium]